MSRLRVILRLKLNKRNKIMAVNTWEASVMRYGTGILKWNTDELKSLDRRARKFMTIHGALYPKSDSCQWCIRMEENKLGWYVRNSVGPFIEGVKAAEIIECNDTVNKNEFKQMDEGKKGTVEEKNVWIVCKSNARKNRWERNMVMAEKSSLESEKNHVVCCLKTSNLNKLCETQDW